MAGWLVRDYISCLHAPLPYRSRSISSRRQIRHDRCGLVPTAWVVLVVAKAWVNVMSLGTTMRVIEASMMFEWLNLFVVRIRSCSREQ